MSKLHILIVSGEQLPNLIPMLMDKPAKAFLLASEDMAKNGNASRLAEAIKRLGIHVEVKENMPDFDMRKIQEYVLQLAADIRSAHPQAEITVNATGGNKLMSMALIDVWKGEANRIIYVDTRHRCIEILPDAQGHVEPAITMGNELDVPTYLRIQGFNYAGAASDDAAWLEQAAKRKEVCKLLAKELAALAWLIGDLNRMASGAIEQSYENGKKVDRLAKPQQTMSGLPSNKNLEVLKKIAAAGLLQWEVGSENIEFIDLEKTRFLSGGWLEEYAWHVLHDEKLFDVRMGVNVTDKQTRNEFDVLACHQNQLLFLECKTLRFTKENDNEIAYKVDSLGSAARGLFGQTWLLSARKPTDILKDRAKKSHIRIIGPDELPKLRDIVREWRS